MKRSEVIEKMAEIMEENFDGNNGSWTADAQKVLDYLEAIGIVKEWQEDEAQ